MRARGASSTSGARVFVEARAFVGPRAIVGPRRVTRPTIVVQKVPIPGGTFADPALCAQTGHGLVHGGTVAAGTGATLLSAAIVDGPFGKTCQIHLRAPEGIALIAELFEPENTPATPKDVWLMTCNHADGDAAAEAACRAALAGFRFRAR